MKTADNPFDAFESWIDDLVSTSDTHTLRGLRLYVENRAHALRLRKDGRVEEAGFYERTADRLASMLRKGK